jgi:exodeoxyribonuclease X
MSSKPSNLLFLDTETTTIENGRMIQLAYKKLGDREIFAEYFKPPTPIEIEAMAVHHITEKMVSDKLPFAQSPVFKTLNAMLPDSILVAHNAKFDIGILANENVKTEKFICTLKVAQSLYDFPQYKMQYLRYLWGIEIDDAIAHDAKGDVAVLEKVFDKMVADYAAVNNGISEEKVVEAFVDISSKPTLLRRVNFGKYAGKTFQEIKALDIGYLQWMSNLPDKDPDFIYSAKYYLEN